MMVVDDNPADLYFAERTFRDAAEIDEALLATEGRSALEQLHERVQKGLPLPVVIMLDLRMPRMGGFAFLDEFETLYSSSSTAIYVLTGHASDPDRMRALSYSSVHGYIVKPVLGGDIARLLSVAKRLRADAEAESVERRASS